MRGPSIVFLAGALAACGGAAPAPAPLDNRATAAPPLAMTEPTLPAADGSTAAPWTAPPVNPASVPAVFVDEWQRAENRAVCPLLAPSWLGAGADARPRPAQFAGSWAVAYDQPDLCPDCADSAFGVAGVGGDVDPDVDARWGQHVRWADGSHAGYGLVGDTGPGWLAYLVVAGAGCNYNVWSNVSEQHLLSLMASLRRVDAR